MDLIITLLSQQHDRASFDCGEPSLNRYLHRYAHQDMKRRVSRIFVATPSDRPHQVVGFYSLSADSVNAAVLPERIRKKLPRYPVPVARLGRLAVAKSLQGQGLGAILLADALKRTVHASEVIAVYAVVVDALNDHAAAFYEQFGFIRLPNQPLTLFLPLDTLKAAMD